MQDPHSVMNNLHRISSQIAAKSGSAGTGNAVSTADSEKKPAVSDTAGISPDLLKRRYTEFLKIRNDLLERLNTMAGTLQQEAQIYNARLAVLQKAADELNRIQDELPPEEPGKESFPNKSELANTTLLMERLRIELLRLTPVIESGSQELARSSTAISGGIAGTGGGKTETGVLLDSLSFRQIFRASFIAALPLIIGGIAAAIIIAVAVIGSFNGMF